MDDTQQQMTGACLCGAVAYLVSGPMRNVIACHCGQCQRTHGHYAAYSNCALEDFRLTNSRGLKWYRSSKMAERVFCTECGASVFWRLVDGDTVSIAAGSLDNGGSLKLVGHIYCDDIPAYYSLTDDLPKFPESSNRNFD